MKILLFILCVVIFSGCSSTSGVKSLESSNNGANDIKKLEQSNGAEDIKKIEQSNGEKDIKLLENNCNNGNAESCFNLAKSYDNGKGVKQDYKQAKDLFGKACDLGDQLGCDNFKRLNESEFDFKLYIKTDK